MSDYSGSEDDDFDIDVVEQQGAFFLPLKTKCKAHEKNVRNLTTSVVTASEKMKNFAIAYLRFNKENMKNTDLSEHPVYKNLSELEEIYESLAQVKNNLRNEQDVYKFEIPRVVDTATNDTNWKAELDKAKKKLEDSRRDAHSSKEARNEFRNEVEANANFKLWNQMELDEDEDMAVWHRPKNIQCPITQDTMNFPVKASCDHVYEREAILQQLKSGENKCPVRGCDHQIQEDELMEDVEIREEIKRRAQLPELEPEPELEIKKDNQNTMDFSDDGF